MPGARRRSWVFYSALAAAFLLAIPLVAWIFRGSIATSIARSELEARGLTCDERFAVELSALFDEARIAPTRCALEGGRIEAVELPGGLTIELEGRSPSAVRAAHVRLILREGELPGGSGWAAQLRRIQLEEPVAGLVKGLAELGGMDLPLTEVARADVLRGAEPLAAVEGLELTPSTPTAIAVRRIAFHPVGGAARLTLDEVHGSASSSAVQLEGRATARAGLAIFAVSAAGAFALEASGLDSATPRLRLRADL